MVTSIAVLMTIAAIVLATVGGIQEKARFSNAYSSYEEVKGKLFDKTRYRFDFDQNDYTSSSMISTTGTLPAVPYQQSLDADTDLFKKGYNLNLGGSGAGSYGYAFRVNNNKNIAAITSDYNFTLALWLKPSSSQSGRVIVGIGEDGNLTSEGLKIITSSGKICARIYSNSNLLCGSDIKVNEWAYIIASVKNDGGGNVTLDLYINGTKYSQSFSGVVDDSYAEDTLGVGSACCIQYRAFGLYDEIILVDDSF